jgi:uncharacterized protein YpiB (UPF0302 family)
MRATLNQLVRDQILNESPGLQQPWLQERYIEEQLNEMPNAELLRRISNAIESMHRDDFESLSVRLGI